MGSATDHQMAASALCDYNLGFICLEISLFFAFNKFVHVIFFFNFPTVLVLRGCFFSYSFCI